MSDTIIHFGVKGMKWGVRKDRDRKSKKVSGELAYSEKLSNGGTLQVFKKNYDDESLFMKLLLTREDYGQLHSFTLADKNGNAVGEASFTESNNGRILDLEWIGVKRSERRQGYARATLNGVIKYAEDRGVETLTLTATKMGAPLYESLGFVADKNKRGRDTSYYTKTLKSSIAHSTKTVIDYVVEALNRYHDLDRVEDVGRKAPMEELSHYGVPGMKWGVRKGDDIPKSTRQSRAEEHFLKKGSSPAEATALAEKRIRTQNRAIGVGVAAALAVGTYMVVDAKVASGKLKFDAESTNRVFEAYGAADSTIAKGARFVRNTNDASNGGWGNSLRTYAVKADTVAEGQKVVSMFGKRTVDISSKVTRESAGLGAQIKAVRGGGDARDLSSDYVKSRLSAHNPLSRKLAAKKNETAKGAVAYMHRTGFGADPKTSNLSKEFLDRLRRAGYSSVRDSNHVGRLNDSAYVLFSPENYTNKFV